MHFNLLCSVGLLIWVAFFASSVKSQDDLPTAYEYFTEGGISQGLVAANKQFLLNGKFIRILSGTIHHFRCHPSQWRTRLRQLRAMGANTVETYVAWNLHEPHKDQFDFGQGSNDLSPFADIRSFVELAQEEDLLVILRPGPFICAEWEFGGLPSWIQSGDQEMKVRQNYKPFLDRVEIYFQQLLSKLVDLQFTRGGSIIAMQIENEYGAFSPRSVEYLQFIEKCYKDNDFNSSLFFTSDHNFGEDGFAGAVPGVLQTANTHDPDDQFAKLQKIQPDMPLMAMEYYTGWMTHWFETKAGGRDPQDYIDYLVKSLAEPYNGSINFYVFLGGTNFAFMNGANTQGSSPFLTYDVTSYDFDALITEAGDYTYKYNMTEDLIDLYSNPKLRKPARPAESRKVAYPTITFQEGLSYTELIDLVPLSHKIKINGTGLLSMEDLPINNGSGQSYGYIIYRLEDNLIKESDVLTVSWPRDFTQVLLDGQLISNGLFQDGSEYWINSVKSIALNMTTNQPSPHTLDVFIENMGRVGFGADHELVQHKGLAPIHKATLKLNEMDVQGVQIIALEFTNAWVKNITSWRSGINGIKAPCALRTEFTIEDPLGPGDTFLDMRDWHKGIVFVNGFNIGRYFKAGPPQTLYVPSALLLQGKNEIIVFEQLEPANEIKFTTTPILGR